MRERDPSSYFDDDASAVLCSGGFPNRASSCVLFLSLLPAHPGAFTEGGHVSLPVA